MLKKEGIRMNLKEKLKAGKSICGTLVNIPAICIAKMMGYFDYDYSWFCNPCD